MDRQEERDMNVLSEATIHERLEEMNIEINIDDSEGVESGTHLTGSVRSFDEQQAAILEEQEIEIINDVILYSRLDDPYLLTSSNMSASVRSFLNENVIYGSEYELSEYDEDEQVIRLHQTFEDIKIQHFDANRYHLEIHINDDMEVEAYYQTNMSLNEHGREQEVLTPVKAIENLFNEQLIPENTAINDVELGYYSLFEPIDDIQIFAPMWRVNVNGKNYYVNAIDGAIQN